MAINFPNSPAVGDEFLDPATNNNWRWDGNVWTGVSNGIVGPTGPQGVQGPQGPMGESTVVRGGIAPGPWTPPDPAPRVGDLYIAEGAITGGITAVAGDGIIWDGAAWINIGPMRGPQGLPGAQGPTGPQGAQGIPGPVGPQGPSLVGMVAMWAAGTPPAGWLECNGQATTGFPMLAAVVGTNVPDLRGEFVRGWDHGRNVDAGRTINTFQNEDTNLSNINIDVQIGVRDTNFTCDNQGAPCTATDLRGVSYWKTGHLRLHSATGGDETRPRNISLMYIIKHD